MAMGMGGYSTGADEIREVFTKEQRLFFA